ncbi:hypothetical protein HMN09_01170900 [Mycena chlorophos]|nr:hypothetical protein HMN09_01170900 [Mycena chlorophos]
MHFNAALFVAAASVALVQAADYRLLYTLPANTDTVTFAVEFGNACATWAPALSSGATFEAFNVEAGDYQGKNTATEVLIDCVFTASGAQTAYTTDVAASLGATPASD